MVINSCNIMHIKHTPNNGTEHEYIHAAKIISYPKHFLYVHN